MLVLDTDHLAFLERGGAPALQQAEKLQSSGEHIATTIVSAEEQLRGWMAQIARTRDPLRQIRPDARLQARLEFFAEWEILPWDERASEQYQALAANLAGIGTMDLKIAYITLVNEATLLSRNLRDFHRVPGLRVQSWL